MGGALLRGIGQYGSTYKRNMVMHSQQVQDFVLATVWRGRFADRVQRGPCRGAAQRRLQAEAKALSACTRDKPDECRRPTDCGVWLYMPGVTSGLDCWGGRCLGRYRRD